MASAHEERNREATRRFYALAASGDRAAVEAMLSDDLVITEGASLPYAGVFKGKNGLRELGAKVASHYGGMSLDIQAICAGADWTLTLLDIIPAGKTDRVSLVEGSRFDDEGRIVEIKPFYFDHDQVRRLGAGGAA